MGGRKMIIGAVAALALPALVLGGCGGGDNNDKTPSASASPARSATVAASPSAAASATAAGPATEAPGAATEVPTQAPQGGATSAPPAPPTTAPPPPPPPTQAPPPPPPPPQNLALTVVAQDVKFSPSSLSAATGAALTVTLDNRDAGVPHNIVFYAPGGGTLASSATITGPATATVAFAPPGAGGYTFKCSVHPQQMFGVLTVS
jgi:plastocyanin